MLRLRRQGITSFAIGVLVLAFSIQLAWAQTAGTTPGARALITQSVDERNLAPLRGNTRPEATPQNDRGAVSDAFPVVHLLLQLRRSPEQESALQRFLDEVQDPASPNFHKWLTPEQYGQDFGVAQQDVDAVERWLELHGFTVNLVYPNRMMIDFSGTAGQVREAFHTEIHNLEVNGEGHIANTRAPQIPSALAPAIVGIVSLHDFKPRAQHEMRTAGANYTFNSGGANYALVPADLATIYNLNPLFSAGYSGQGQTIVVIEDTNVFNTSDWSTFRSTFGLSGYSSGSFSTIHPAPSSGPNNCADPGVVALNDSEAILDAEWAGAAAPSAAILLASCADTTTNFGGLIALQNLINASSQPPAVVSISYGECETQNGASANAAYYAAYQQAVAEGISVFVSAGDSGAAGCDNNATDAIDGIGVNAFASTPYNVAVGGTDFSDTYSGTNAVYWNSTNTSNFGSALSYVPEIPWNDSCASVLISTFVTGSGTTYGSTGFCNSASGGNYLTTVAGSGGPSACATGSPSLMGAVGGTCQGWPKPSWQSALSNFGNPNDGVRDTPDVSLFAANGVWLHYYVICFSDTANGGAPCTGAPSSWAGAGGTSFASPIMAGIQALVNQKTGQRQGNPNPVYYQLAANEYNLSSSSCNSANGNGVASTCTFYDITQGDIDVNCTGSNNCYLPSGSHGVLSTSDNSYRPAYGTTTGWDFATGIGSVNATNLVNNWPGGVVATGGTPQSTTINTPFPASLVVTVKNASGNPVNGVTVTFTPPSTGASGSFAGGANTATTNASGVATSATFSANGISGGYTVTASAVGITGTGSFSLTNTPGPPASITATSGAPQSTAINTPFPVPLVVTAKDASGNPVNGVTVTFTPPSSGASGSFAGGANTAITNASGVATSATFSANGTSGSYTVTASVAVIAGAASFSLTNTSGPPASISATSGTPQSAAINIPFPMPLVVTVRDASGNPVNGVTVTFTPPSSGASGSFAGGANTATTNASGVAMSAAFTANGTPGSYTVTVRVPGIVGTASFSLTNTPAPPANITATSGTPQSANDDTAFGAPLVATVTDASGNPLSSVTVTFTAPSTGASGNFASGANTATTNASGVATSATFTANGTLGSYTVKASVSGVTSTANFSLTNTLGPPASTTATSGTAQIGPINSAFAARLAAIVKDAGGNPISGATVTFTPPGSGASGTFAVGGNIATTNASGVATSAAFTANATTGSYTVTASVPGVTTTASFSLTNMDFSVALDVPGTVQITRGTPATVKLDIATIPANTPLPAAVDFACLVPPGLSGAACSLSSPAILAGSTSGNTILTITTMAASEQSPPAAGPSSRLPGLPLVSSAALLALVAMLGMMGIFSAGPWLRPRPRRLPAYLMLALLAITSLGLLSCGGTSSSSPVSSSVSATPTASNTGTPVGPSIVTVTATSGNVSKATTININVN